MAGYTRQAAANIADGLTINAADFNAEYDALEDAFDATTGHSHGGGVGEGAPLNRSALNGFGANTGLVVADSGTTFVARTLTGTANEITVTNGSGVSGAPTLSLPTALTFTGKTITGGTFTGGTFSGLTLPWSSITSTPTTLSGYGITDAQPLDSDLTAVAGLATTGLIARTGSGTAATRTITGPAAGITVTDGDGVSGNPTLALANDLAAVEGLATTGLVRRTGTSTWSAGSTVDTAEITDDAVTYAKLQNVSATSRILGRKTASAGDAEECTLSEILDFIGSAAQGDILYRGASGWSRLAAGTKGQGLVTGGSSANPAWGSPGIITQQSKSANYTFALGDEGTCIFHPASDANARTFTIPANSSVAFAIGSSIEIENRSANNVTLAITTDTLTWYPTGGTGSRTIAQYGKVVVQKIGSTEWSITGVGVT